MSGDNSNRITITVEQFRTAFPAFTQELYPDSLVEQIISQSYCYVSNYGNPNNPCPCRVLMIELMTAHLLYLTYQAQQTMQNGGSSLSMGLVQRSKVGEVEISMAVPTSGLTVFRAWLLQSPWGQQLFGLIQSHNMPLFYGGSFNRVFWTSSHAL